MTNITPVKFKIPQEPLPVPPVSNEMPVPSVGSDEESFVVLGKSLIADVDDLSFEADSSFGKSIIQEGKQLIKEELDRIEQKYLEKLSNNNENSSNIPNENEVGTSLAEGNTISKKDNQMEKSAVLPEMPQPLNTYGTDSGDISRTISIISFSPSEFSSEELHSKVSQLIEENVHLKDTILQNNMSMKAQYEKIVAWQKDVEKVHEAHKEKFRQAKQCIESLKKEISSLKQEKSMLTQEIENLRYSLKLQFEQEKTKEILSKSNESNSKDSELEIANKKIRELEEVINKMKITSADENLSRNWKAMEEKLIKFENELESAYKRNRELEISEEQTLQTLKVVQAKLQLTEQANKQTENEILSLRKQLAKNIQSAESPSKLEIEQSQRKIQELEELLVLRNENLIDANVRLEKTGDEYSAAREEIKIMEVNLSELREKLEETKIELWKNKQKLNEKEMELQMLQKDFDLSKQEKQRIDTSQSLAEIPMLRQQLMQSQVAVTRSDQNRAIAQAQLEVQKQEIADLRSQLEAKQNENDDIFALRTQLDVYKADFEAEREAKEEIRRDKNKLSEDLQHLHRRNQQMQEEIELLRDRTGNVTRVRHESSSSGEAASGWSTHIRNGSPFTCPKCQFGFYTLQAVENHVMRCIELDEVLP